MSFWRSKSRQIDDKSSNLASLIAWRLAKTRASPFYFFHPKKFLMLERICTCGHKRFEGFVFQIFFKGSKESYSCPPFNEKYGSYRIQHIWICGDTFIQHLQYSRKSFCIKPFFWCAFKQYAWKSVLIGLRSIFLICPLGKHQLSSVQLCLVKEAANSASSRGSITISLKNRGPVSVNLKAKMSLQQRASAYILATQIWSPNPIFFFPPPLKTKRCILASVQKIVFRSSAKKKETR